MSKMLILGHQLAGKTTLINYLRQTTKLSVSEMDEEILSRNDGNWPADNEVINRQYVPNVMTELIAAENKIFFASYLGEANIKFLKQADYKIYILEISREEIVKRNNKRVNATGRDYASPWVVGQTELIELVEDDQLVDGYIDAEVATSDVASIIIDLYNQG